MKEQLAAYLIMESMSDPVPVKNVEFNDKNGLFYVRFDTVLQDFNTKNRNNRIYMSEAMIPSLMADHIMELQSKGSWGGEFGHPHSDDIKRILTIDPKLVSHRIVKHEVNSARCTGTIETFDNEYGRQFSKMILQGLEPAFSLRALAPLVKRPDGVSIVKTKAHVVTYDAVILPSHKVAYRDKSKPVEKIFKSLAENGNDMTHQSLLPVHESMITDFIAMESMNVKLISNVCEVALESMQLSKDTRHVILKESGNTYIVPLEEKIQRDISAYMKNI